MFPALRDEERVVHDNAGTFHHVSDLQLVEEVHGCRTYVPCVEVHAALSIGFVIVGGVCLGYGSSA